MMWHRARQKFHLVELRGPEDKGELCGGIMALKRPRNRPNEAYLHAIQDHFTQLLLNTTM